jgi:hypothetical protein
VRRAPQRARTLALAIALVFAAACVSYAHSRAREARARYERCIAAAGESACQSEKERMLAAERGYQAEALRVWGCDPSQPDCPPDR